MTHQNDEKHEHHRKDREHEKKLEKAREDKEMQQPRTIHPGWFVALGIALTAGVVFVWVFVW